MGNVPCLECGTVFWHPSQSIGDVPCLRGAKHGATINFAGVAQRHLCRGCRNCGGCAHHAQARARGGRKEFSSRLRLKQSFNDSLHFSLQAIELTLSWSVLWFSSHRGQRHGGGSSPTGAKDRGRREPFFECLLGCFLFLSPPKQRGSGRAATPLRKRSDHFSSLGSLLALQTV